MKKIVSIIGARPQFVKASVVSRHIRKKFSEITVHTGQHYDPNMSPVFFEELEIPQPDYNLGIGGGTNLEQIGRMLPELEKVFLSEKPDLVLVYGDTNSTLAGALAAASLSIKLGHVESGLRSFNREMPEEINRVLTDHLAQFLFTPNRTAVGNLKKEGIERGVFLTGDVMYDACLHFSKIASSKSKILAEIGLKPESYLFATVHRGVNTDNRKNLESILDAFGQTGDKIVFPVHPRTKKAIKSYGLTLAKNILQIEPVGYLDSLMLETNASKIITDSGGVQKEAYFLGKPCITLRGETEWVETVEDGWNILVGSNREKIKEEIQNFAPNQAQKNHFGDGKASQKIVKILADKMFPLVD